MNIKMGKRVLTPHGEGTTIEREPFGTRGDYRIVVRLDVKPELYKDNILYYYRNQVSAIN